MLDVPDEVRNKVIAEGNAAWLDELPSVVESLAQDWSLTIGATLRGGHAAFVVEATLADGTAAVLKVGVPGTRRDLSFEATALRLADGDGCASLLRDDLDRSALLLERLGAAMYDVVPDPATRHDMLCDVAARLWRPVGPDVDLPTGADKAREYADLLPRLWEETGTAVLGGDRRGRSSRARSVAAAPTMTATPCSSTATSTTSTRSRRPTARSSSSIPGLRAEPACDLGTIIRCNPDSRRRPARQGEAAGRPHWCGRHRDLGVGNDPPRHRRPLQPADRVPAVRRPAARRGRSAHRMNGWSSISRPADPRTTDGSGSWNNGADGSHQSEPLGL